MTGKTTDFEAVQAAIEAFASGDTERMVEHIHPDFEGVVPPSMSAEPDDYRGHDGVRRYFRLWRESIDDLTFKSEVLEERGDWILAAIHVGGQGRTSGIPVDLDAVAAIQMQDSKLLRMVGYPSLEEARAAVAVD